MLDEQIARAREAALHYPTFGEAHDAGFRAIGPAVPGLGVHVRPLDGWTPPEGVFSDDNSLVQPRA